MKSLNSHFQKSKDDIEYSLAKLDIEDFQKLTPDQQKYQKQRLARIRIQQIEAHHEVYPQGVTGNLRRIANNQEL